MNIYIYITCYTLCIHDISCMLPISHDPSLRAAVERRLCFELQVGSEWASRITEFVAGFNAFRVVRGLNFYLLMSASKRLPSGNLT
jgi:hypothetical protein